MTAPAAFTEAFAACPLIAILRGVRPEEVEDIGDALGDAGFTLIEVPLNSPDPFQSIVRLSGRLAGRALVGAGTVVRAEDVQAIRNADGRMVVSPNANPEVITATVEAGMASVPGYFTPSEAFAALEAGAHALKLFPAEGASPALLRAHLAVLPRSTPILVVGGIKSDTLAPWIEAGARGFGLGSALYRPGMTSAEVARTAATFVEAWRAISAP